MVYGGRILMSTLQVIPRFTNIARNLNLQVFAYSDAKPYEI